LHLEGKAFGPYQSRANNAITISDKASKEKLVKYEPAMRHIVIDENYDDEDSDIEMVDMVGVDTPVEHKDETFGLENLVLAESQAVGGGVESKINQS
jgi:hypothetical protein